MNTSELVRVAADADDSFAWPVLVIGGAIVVAGLLAVRTEFGNWRSRRRSTARARGKSGVETD